MAASSLDDLAHVRQIEELTAQLSKAQAERDDAHRREAATAEILHVISKCTTDVQPVFDAIVVSSKSLLGGHSAVVSRVVGRELVLAAYTPINPTADDELMRTYPRSLEGASPSASAVRDGAPCVIGDTERDNRVPPSVRESARSRGFRSILSVPMLSMGTTIGTINVTRTTPGAFSDKDIALLQTFADQAVIAIENTRLFEEVQARTRELTVSLDQQTSSAKILSVISATPGEVQPVFDTILAEATRLCEAQFGVLTRFDGTAFIPVGVRGDAPELMDHYQSGFRPSATNAMGRILRTKEPVHLADAREGAAYKAGDPAAKSIVEVGGARSYLLVPLLKDNEVVGAITIFRKEVRPFSGKQIELLASFADQAVIAIENSRLFEEVQARTRELQEALDQQTATSEVLSVISSSPGELDAVFHAMLVNAVRICEANFGTLHRYDGTKFCPVAMQNTPPALAEFQRKRGPFVPERGNPLDRMLQTKRVVHVIDDTTEKVPSPAGRLGGARSLIAVPMLKENELVGAIFVYRQEVRPFTDKQIELVESFASQAVIAVENTRLLNELRDSLQQQTATADVLKVISRSALELQSVLGALVSSASHLCDAPMVAIHVERDGSLPGRARHGFSTEVLEALSKIGQVWGRGSLAGRTIAEGKPVHIPDVETDAEYTFNDFTRITAARSMLGVPLLRDGRPVGLLSLYRTRMTPFTLRQIELMATFADQAVIAIENARLFEELQTRTRELAKTVEDLEIASQHKSQFVANMSHELRTPLAAILGYAELMQEGFYDPLGQKSLDALTRIRSNGKHLLGLINTVLDIAKIESGQFTLNMVEYAIESVVETVRSATESLAQNKKLTLTTDVAKSMPIGLDR
jgi:two-component system, NtrC family, sensor kinase